MSCWQEYGWESEVREMAVGKLAELEVRIPVDACHDTGSLRELIGLLTGCILSSPHIGPCSALRQLEGVV